LAVFPFFCVGNAKAPKSGAPSAGELGGRREFAENGLPDAGRACARMPKRARSRIPFVRKQAKEDVLCSYGWEYFHICARAG
jgi:hypothetical protein